MRVLAFILPATCLFLQAGEEVRWERIPADLSKIRLHPLLRLASYRFNIIFDASIEKRKFVNIRNLEGPELLVPGWASTELPKIRLGARVVTTSGHFRLCMNHGDPHLEQQIPR